MNTKTVQLLNQLNTLFYQTVASSFDETRARPWQGWIELLPYVKTLQANPIRVLDLGCGNGRFGVFLHEHFPIRYMGVDSSRNLIAYAAKNLLEHKVYFTLQEGDLLDPALDVSSIQEEGIMIPPELLGKDPETTYDLVTLFGVMHHIPGFENRRQLLQRAYDWLNPDGLLVVTFWTFYENPRLKERIVSWSDERVPLEYRQLELEPNDFLLDWRRDTPALRYCHYVDQAEEEKLLEGMTKIATYDADSANRYVVVKKHPS